MSLIGVLDLESTGVDVANDRICEIAVVVFDTEKDREVAAYERRINPEVNIPAKTTAVHGIANADVMGAPTFRQVAPLLAKLIERVDVLVGHNVRSFDAPMLIHEMLRAGVAMTATPIIFDTMIDTRWATPDGKFPTLGELAWSLDVPYDPAQAHGALYDVRITLAAFREAVRLGLFEMPVIPMKEAA